VDDLVSWLRGRWDERERQLAEDERVALAAPGPDWVIGTERAGEPGQWRGRKADLVLLPPDGPFPMDLDVGAEVLRAEFVNDGRFAGRWAVEHAARHDPARVLAKVERGRRDIVGKRAILDLHAGEHDCPEMVTGTYPADWPAEASWGKAGERWAHPSVEHFEADQPCPTVRLLAQEFEGEPGWREEWRA
jgi:hypothetical protein